MISTVIYTDVTFYLAGAALIGLAVGITVENLVHRCSEPPAEEQAPAPAPVWEPSTLMVVPDTGRHHRSEDSLGVETTRFMPPVRRKTEATS